jgi:hypothetical protein
MSLALAANSGAGVDRFKPRLRRGSGFAGPRLRLGFRDRRPARFGSHQSQ